MGLRGTPDPGCRLGLARIAAEASYPPLPHRVRHAALMQRCLHAPALVRSRPLSALHAQTPLPRPSTARRYIAKLFRDFAFHQVGDIAVVGGVLLCMLQCVLCMVVVVVVVVVGVCATHRGCWPGSTCGQACGCQLGAHTQGPPAHFWRSNSSVTVLEEPKGVGVARGALAP